MHFAGFLCKVDCKIHETFARMDLNTEKTESTRGSLKNVIKNIYIAYKIITWRYRSEIPYQLISAQKLLYIAYFYRQ